MARVQQPDDDMPVTPVLPDPSVEPVDPLVPRVELPARPAVPRVELPVMPVVPVVELPVMPVVPRVELPVIVLPVHGLDMIAPGAGTVTALMPRVGTAIIGLTPALLISVESSGIAPLRGDTTLVPGVDSGEAIPVDDAIPDVPQPLAVAVMPDVRVPAAIPVDPPPSKEELIPPVIELIPPVIELIPPVADPGI